MTTATIVVCVYDGAATLGQALDSALAQTMDAAEFEVLIVDDGSTDATADICRRYEAAHGNLRYVHQQHAGLAAACNRGLADAQGRLFIRLDADDTIATDTLESMERVIETEPTDLVCSDREEVFPGEGRTEAIRVGGKDIYELIAAGTMLRTELLRNVGGYRDLFWEEYDLYLTYLSASGRPMYHIGRPLYAYTRHPGGMTADPAATEQGWRELAAAWDAATLNRFGAFPRPDLLSAS